MPEGGGEPDPRRTPPVPGVQILIGGSVTARAHFHGDLSTLDWRALISDIQGDANLQPGWQQGPSSVRIIEPGHPLVGLEALVFVEGPEIIGRCPFS